MIESDWYYIKQYMHKRMDANLANMCMGYYYIEEILLQSCTPTN